jgi:hypothetical protein
MNFLEGLVPGRLRSELGLHCHTAIALNDDVAVLLAGHGIHHHSLKRTQTVFDDVSGKDNEFALLLFDESLDCFSLVVLFPCAIVTSVEENVSDTKFLRLHPFASAAISPSEIAQMTKCVLRNERVYNNPQILRQTGLICSDY